jgi:phosphatidylserine decarboxylase
LVSREGYPIILFFLALTGLLFFFSLPGWGYLALGMSVFSIWFFRNPERVIPESDDLILSPADGKVLDIIKIHECRFMGSESIRIRIFMSIFNVHVNRAPYGGRVEWIERHGICFMPAFDKKAPDLNVRNYIGISCEYGKILVVQITGFFARRLVCWIKSGEEISAGQRLGLIRFGSCTELYIPVNSEVLIKPGDKVKGGVTVVARFKSQDFC